MASLEITALSTEQRPTGAWAASLLHALARDEAAGRRPARLTEPRLATWTRFRGRLGPADLIALLFEDAAVLHKIPFDPAELGGPLALGALPDTLAEEWLRALPTLDLQAASADYILGQARLLGLPTRLARSELHMVKPHQRVLELPGTGGQLAHHIVSTQTGLTLQDNFTVACGSWEELTLAGIVGLDRGAPHTRFALKVELEQLREPEHELRKRSFDFVVGLDPEKGGLFRIEDQLAIWFSGAKVVLV